MTRPDASYRELARARVPMTARDHMSRARAELVAALRAMGVEPDAKKTA